MQKDAAQGISRTACQRLLLVAVICAALSVSCGGGPESDAPASSSGASQTATSLTRQQENQLQSEWSDRWVSCLRGEGIQIQELPDGGVELNYEGLSDDDFERLDSECQEQAGPLPTPAPVSEAEARQLYQWDLETRQCFIDSGFTPVEPSSEQEYVDNYLVMQAPWSPYEGIEDIPGAQAACPQRALGED